MGLIGLHTNTAIAASRGAVGIDQFLSAASASDGPVLNRYFVPQQQTGMAIDTAAILSANNKKGVRFRTPWFFSYSDELQRYQKSFVYLMATVRGRKRTP